MSRRCARYRPGWRCDECGGSWRVSGGNAWPRVNLQADPPSRVAHRWRGRPALRLPAAASVPGRDAEGVRGRGRPRRYVCRACTLSTGLRLRRALRAHGAVEGARQLCEPLHHYARTSGACFSPLARGRHVRRGVIGVRRNMMRVDSHMGRGDDCDERRGFMAP